jgi:hypothetical protein
VFEGRSFRSAVVLTAIALGGVLAAASRERVTGWRTSWVIPLIGVGAAWSSRRAGARP